MDMISEMRNAQMWPKEGNNQDGKNIVIPTTRKK
jgi:hypothetical protein